MDLGAGRTAQSRGIKEPGLAVGRMNTFQEFLGDGVGGHTETLVGYLFEVEVQVQVRIDPL